jgi:hypothetical protein
MVRNTVIPSTSFENIRVRILLPEPNFVKSDFALDTWVLHFRA